MIGMSFASFLTLLILGLIAAIVVHSIIRYRMLKGVDGFFAKWIGGWIGAWLGSPVLGHWWAQIQNVYLIPALIGAFVGAFSFVVFTKANAVAASEAMAPKMATSAVVPEMLKKGLANRSFGSRPPGCADATPARRNVAQRRLALPPFAQKLKPS